jgi:Tfp pilus assembly protein PilZ
LTAISSKPNRNRPLEQSMRLLTVVFVSSAEFLSHYREADGSMFHRTRAELEPGEELLAEISFPGLPNRALVRARVLEVDPGKGGWLAFSDPDVSTRDFLVRLARGEVEVTAKAERNYDRFPATVPVDCELEQSDAGDGERVVSRTADLGAGGVFIRTDVSPPLGTRVRLVIGPVDGDPEATFTVEGQVARVRDDDGRQGFAVRFEPRGGGDNAKLRALLRRGSERGKVELAGPEEAE